MRRTALLVPAALALLAPLGAAAQDASPTAGTTLPPCTVEPLPVEQIVGYYFGPGGEALATPLPASPIAGRLGLPEGEPLDPETEAAIDATYREWLACFVFGNQYARGFALMTEDAARQFGPDLADPAEDTAEEVAAGLEAQLAGTPGAAEALPPDLTIRGPRQTRQLPDGRAGAVFALGGDAAFVVFEGRDGRWLIADFVDIAEAGAAATPSA